MDWEIFKCCGKKRTHNQAFKRISGKDSIIKSDIFVVERPSIAS